MLKISSVRWTDCNFPAVSGLNLGSKWTQENPALNVNFSILGAVLDPVLVPVLDLVLGSKLLPH